MYTKILCDDSRSGNQYDNESHEIIQINLTWLIKFFNNGDQERTLLMKPVKISSHVQNITVQQLDWYTISINIENIMYPVWLEQMINWFTLIYIMTRFKDWFKDLINVTFHFFPSPYKANEWFEKTFENSQWRKIKQMQPMRLCIFLGRQFEQPFEDTRWIKITKMEPVWQVQWKCRNKTFFCFRCSTFYVTQKCKEQNIKM